MREESRVQDPWIGPATVAAVLLVAAAATLRRIWAADFWWQYAAGAWVSRHGWPTLDAFSYTAGDRPWIELHWLFAVVQYRLMDGIGPASLVVLKGCAVVLAFTLAAWPWLRRRFFVASGAVVVVALLASSHRFFVRPELVTYVMLGLFVLVLDRHRREGGRAIWCLPFAQIVWVNCHPMALLGPLLVGLCGFVLCLPLAARLAGRRAVSSDPDRLLFGRLRTIAILFAVTLVAMLVNPYGLGAYRLPFVMFSEMRGSIFRDAIAELHGPFAFGLRLVAVRWFYLLIALAVGSGVANWRRLDPFWLLLAVSQFYLAVTSIRNLPLFCIVAVPFILSNLERCGALALSSRGALGLWTRRVTAAVVVVTSVWWTQQLVTDRASVRHNDTSQAGFGVARHRFPFAMADTLARHPPGGNVFATLLEGSFLVSRGVPVFADPRLEVYGEEIFGEFLAVQRDVDRFRAMAVRRDVRAALVGLRSPLARRLRGEPGWRLVGFDSVAALYYRDDATSDLPAIEDADGFARAIAAIREALAPPVGWVATGPFERVVSHLPYLGLSDFLILAGQAEPARELLDEAVAAAPFASGLARRRALVSEALEDPQAVVAAATTAIEEDPDDFRSMARLGEAYFRLEQNERARAWLDRSLAGLPDRALTWSTLSRIHLAAENLPDAERCLVRATELAPQDAVYRANLARVAGLQGRTTEAVAGLEAAVGLDPSNVSFYRDLVQLHAMSGNRQAAADYLARGLAVAPNDPGLARLRQALASR